MTKDEALKLALEALEDKHYQEAHYLIVKALAQPAQEPDYWLGYGLQAHTEKPFENATALYTTPPQRPWVGLTDEEVKHMLELFVIPPHHVEMVVQAIEAKLKEKNG